MYRAVERIDGPGEYQLAKNPNTLPENKGVFLCTNYGNMPFNGEWSLLDYLRESLDFQSNRGYLYGKGLYEDRPSTRISQGDNLLVIDGLSYCLNYRCGKERGTNNRVTKIRMRDIEGFKETPSEPTLLPSPDRQGLVELIFKTQRPQNRGQFRWGVWILDESYQPGPAIGQIRLWFTQVVQNSPGLALWMKSV
jgi:hypothetical protein